jgi:predicted permease
MMAKERWVSAVIVLVMALGIGANATVFTLANAVLFKSVPVEEGDRFFSIASQNLKSGGQGALVSWPELQDFRSQTKSFDGIGALEQASINVSDETTLPESYPGAYITPDLFSVVRMKPILGRDMLPEEGKPGGSRAVLLGYGTWKSRYGKDPNVIGRSMHVDGKPATIVGVMPDGFQFPSNASLWVSLTPDQRYEKRDARRLNAFARLKSNADPSEGRAEIALAGERFQKEYAATNKDISYRLITLHELMNGGPIRIVFLALLGAVAFVLLIACANVANLQISRAVARVKEVSVRVALGASRWRVIRQLLIENILLSVLAAGLGLGIAMWGVRAFDNAVADSGKPYWIQFTFEPMVFAYVAAVCLLTGILSGLAPALQLAKVDVNEALKETSRGNTGGRKRWLAQTLVVSELALATVLLAGAGLMIRSLFESMKLGSEFDAPHLMTARVALTDEKYTNAQTREQFANAIVEKVKALPGVNSVTLASQIPYQGSFSQRFELEQKPVEFASAPALDSLTVTPAYFSTLKQSLVRGRDFNESDGTAGHEAAIVNRAFALKHWPQDDPLGKRFRLFKDGAPQPWITVVGIAPDIQQNDPRSDRPDPIVYLPARSQPMRYFYLLASSQVEPASVASSIRSAVASIDPTLPVARLESLSKMLERSRWVYRVFGSLFSIFAAIALGLAAVGIFGVMAYAVGQRKAEIGLRMALGASESSIVSLILRSGLWQLAIGLTLGLAAALGVSRLVTSVLARVSPWDPITYVSVLVILGSAGLLACWLPARRAVRVDPATALRNE